jgi:hypothetical protein
MQEDLKRIMEDIELTIELFFDDLQEITFEVIEIIEKYLDIDEQLGQEFLEDIYNKILFNLFTSNSFISFVNLANDYIYFKERFEDEQQ